MLLDGGQLPERAAAVVEMREGARLCVRCSAAPASLEAGATLQLSLAATDGGFFRAAVEVVSTKETGAFELVLLGPLERVEQRGPLRVDVRAGDLRASLGGEACEVIDLSELAFSVEARSVWAEGDVLEAIVYDQGEALPGRVRVQSATSAASGRTRYGLLCLDGRLKATLAGVCLTAQRARIEQQRRARDDSR